MTNFCMPVLLTLFMPRLIQAEEPKQNEILGKWTGVSAETKDRKGEFASRWEISADKVKIYQMGELRGEWKISLDIRNPLKSIDFTPDRGPASGKLLKGIYRVEKDKLIVCYVLPSSVEPEKQARPDSFEEPGPGVAILTFKRSE